MATRYMDWLRQATRDLEQARDSMTAGRHDWACFASSQAAKMAIKALHDYLGQPIPWGHTLVRLFHDLPGNIRVPDGLMDKALVLDTYYVPTR